MRVLVIGGTGMLGSDVVHELRSRGHEVLSPSSSELDITDPLGAASVASGAYGKIDWCVNCAAYTAVDKAETDADAATLLNAIAPGYLARSCAMAGTKLLHFSTDFVFDGLSSTPYTEAMPTHTLGVYGRTKREGEEAVLAGDPSALILRTAWLYGPNGGSFPRTMIRAW
ncbi:MAG TPA: sugar nucleotide-binding protein, partial [Fimbriimonadaceae bacterium]|nr:sugar nucleotide-binding protein [Fimbriimonadaceae bacterium]